MSENNAPPSVDAANLDSLPGAFSAIWKKLLQSVDDMLPAFVVSHDQNAGTATVQIAIALLTTKNEVISRQPIASVRVLQIGGGGFISSVKLRPGDRGWIKASDRDIGLFAQSFSESAPNSQRLHSFSDGLFIPDVMTGYSIDSEDDGMTLQSLDGSVKISLTDGKIKLTAPLVEIDTPLATFSGEVSIVGEATISGKAFTPHVHSGVQGGGSSSGPVV